MSCWTFPWNFYLALVFEVPHHKKVKMGHARENPLSLYRNGSDKEYRSPGNIAAHPLCRRLKMVHCDKYIYPQ